MAKGDRKNLKQLVGICGIYCGTCPMYLAPQYHDVDYLKESSKKTGLPVEEIRCGGCLSDQLYSSCKECRHGFRECANEKHVTWCFQCHDFPCHRLHSFLNIHIVDGISHHVNLIKELQYMREHGIEDWLEKQDRASQCSKCGKVLYWFDRKCPDCQTPVQRVFLD